MPDWRLHVRKHLPDLRLRPERESEIVEELAAELDDAYRDAIRQGADEAEAARQAEVRFTDWPALAHEIEAAEEPLNHAPSPRLERLTSGIPADLRYALRVLRKSPMFTIVAVCTLAVGIGSSTAIFSLLDAVVLKAIDYREPDQLVMVWESNLRRGFHSNVVAMANYLDWKARAHVFSDLSLILDQVWNLTGAGEPEEVAGMAVSARFLPMLGVQPLIGRSFLANEAAPGAPQVAILSHRLWARKCASNPAVIGRSITLDGTPVTVIGVLPADFPWLGKPLDVLTAERMPARDWRVAAGRFLRVTGRLKPGVSIAQARSELNGIARQLEVEHPEFNKDWGVEVVPMAEYFAGKAATALWIIMFAVGMVLLIACSNVANLMLARAAVREREMAVRATLGASTGRLVRLLLIESTALALAGGALGSAGAWFAIRLVQTYGPQDVSRLGAAAFSGTVAGFALLASFAAATLFGLAPAFAAARLNLTAALKEGGRGGLGSVRGNRLRSTFVVAEVALALVLLISASLLLESYVRLSSQPTGFDSHNVLTASVSFSGKSDGARLTTTCRQMLDRMRQLPEVEDAGFITFLPFAGMGAATGFRVAGGPDYAAGQEPVTDARVVQPGYFETMRIPLRRGRLFTEADNRVEAPRVFVVNETMAREAFGAADPLGQRLTVQMGDDKPGVIVGVVGDTKHLGLDGAVRPMVYYAQAHLPISFGAFVIRAAHNPETLGSGVTAAIREVIKDQPVSDIRTMDQWIGRSIAQQRFETSLAAAFAVIAVLLAMIGVYGVVSYSVEQRTHEIGVRLAIGAQPAAVRWWITAKAMRLAAVGVALGLCGAASCTRLFRSLLYEITPIDAFTFVTAAGLLALVCVIAIQIPARRATQVDPLVALRQD